MARAADPILARDAATRIVTRLREAGHTAFFAGGCVRDELLNLEPTDFDVATDAVPARVRELFPRTAEVGAAFGVVLVYQHTEPHPPAVVEVATFRSDGPYTDSRRPDHVHFSSPEEDARRRDFTINALFLDPLLPPGAPGRVIDFVGGQADLVARLIRAVGDPDQRLAEDHLRALRAVRFAARLGFEIEGRTAAAIHQRGSALKGVSKERIGDEIRRMLRHTAAAARTLAIQLIETLGLDGPVLNEPPRGPGDLGILHRLDAEPLKLGTMLAAWCIQRKDATSAGLDNPQIRAVCAQWRSALCLSNDESDEFSDALTIHAVLNRDWSSARVAKRKRWAARVMFPGGLAIVRAIDSGVADRIASDVKELENDGVGIRPQPLITGEDLIAHGLSPGPRFKRILDEVTDAQLEGLVRDKAAAMELVERLSV